MHRSLRTLSIIICFFFAFASFQTVSPARADTSTGCSIIGTVSTFPMSPARFNAGDVVTFSAVMVPFPGATFAYFEIRDELTSTILASASYPSGNVSGTLSYTVPADGMYAFNWGANFYAIASLPAAASFFTVTASCKGASFAGRGIPPTFVLRSIWCNTPVYSAAGGDAVKSGESIKSGQSWFVSPTPVKDGKGNLWSEIFVSGVSNGFIPTACVGGKPDGYSGD